MPARALHRRCLCLAALALPAAAQDLPLFGELHGETGFEFLGRPLFTDIDGDGDLDVFVLRWLDESHVFLNEGAAGLRRAPGPPVAGSHSTSVAVGDVDGDGNVDLLVGNTFMETFGSPNSLYLGDGRGGFTLAQSSLPTPASHAKTNGVALFDADGDGDLDAFMGNAGGNPFSNELYLNDGTGVFIDASGQLPVSICGQVLVLDVEGDGDPDLLLGNGAADRILLNDGSGHFAFSPFKFPVAPAVQPMDAGDVDGDGDLDLLFGNQAQDWLMLNDGSGKFTLAPGNLPGPSQSIPTGAVELVDMDGDGDLDALVGSQFAVPSRLLLNDGAGVFAPAPQSYFSLPGARWLGAGDLDGDGDADVAAFGRLLLNRGHGELVDVTVPAIPSDPIIPTAVALGDVDRDGDLDAILAEKLALRLRTNDGTGFFREATGSFPPIGSAIELALADVERDGDLDLLVGTENAPDRLLLNDGTGSFSYSGSPFPATSTLPWLAVFGDVDGDGDCDLALGLDSKSAPNRLYLNDGQGAFADATAQLPASAARTRGGALADLDGDGDLDLFFANAEQDQLFLNDGTGTFADASARLPIETGQALAGGAGDVDADGDVDLLVGNSGLGRVALYLNDGSASFSDASGQILGAPANARVALCDLDGDGDLDFWHANSEGHGFHLNDGAGGFAPGRLARSVDAFAPDFALGDLDLDGDADAWLAAWYQDQLLSNLTVQLAWRATPAIGKPTVFEIHGPPGGRWVLFGSLGLLQKPFMGPSGEWRIDRAQVFFARRGRLDARGRAEAVWPVPDDPALVGVTFYWQAVVASPVRFTGLERTTITDL